ncbi:MAG: hypothetical protein ACYC3I_19645 [Gemmataceae bacterium]
MNRLRFPLLATMCLIGPATASWSAPAPAARSGLEQVPASAPIVLHLRGVQGARDRFVALMEKALPDVLKKFQSEMDDFLKNGYNGHKYRGLAKDGPIFLALLDLPKPNQRLTGPPPFAFIVAVSDYKEFRDNILTEEDRKNIKDKGDGIEEANFERETVYFVDRKGFAIVTMQEDVAKSFTQRFTGLHTKMSKELAAKFLSSDAGVYVNMDAINKEYGEQIKEAKESIEQGLNGPLAAGGDEAQKKFIDLFKKAIGPIFQGVEDMNSFLWTLEFRPGGLALHLQSEMKESTPTANLLQDARPVALKDLDHLPRDRAYYLGMKGNASLYKKLAGFLSVLPDVDGKALETLMEDLAQAGPDSVLGGGSFPMAGLTVYHFDDPAKAVNAVLKYYRDVDPKAAEFKKKPVIKMDAEKHGDFKLHFVQYSYDFDKMAKQLGDDVKKQFIESMKGFFGEKTTMWIGTDGKTAVQITAPDWSSARKLLDQYSKGKDRAGEAQAFRDARKEMPARTSILGLIDAVPMFATIAELYKPILPPGVLLPPGREIVLSKVVSAYVGLAVTLQPNRGSFDLFITVAAAREFYKAAVKPLVGE